jgi:FAD synthase
VTTLLRPLDSGLDRFPIVPLSAEEVAAILRGQFVRPAGWHAVNAANAAAAAEGVGLAGGAGVAGGAEPGDDAAAAGDVAADQPDGHEAAEPHAPREPTGPRGLHYRLVDSDGSLVAIAGVRGGRLAPEKVLKDLAPGTSATRTAGPSAPAKTTARPRQARDRRGAPTHVIDGLSGLLAEDGPVFVVVGVFDGLHRGHLYLLEQLRAEAARRSAHGLVVTFDAHPEEVLLGKAPPILVDQAERLVRLGEAGVEHTVVTTFDNALRTTPFDEFVAMIARGAGLAGFLMTPDAAFGHDRLGTPHSLAELGTAQGFEVVVVPPFEIDGRQVRSSEIRQHIADGDLAAAAALLGRPVAFVGERRGWADRSPDSGPEATAALDFRLPVALPPAGEYAVEIEPAWQPGVQRGPVVRGTAMIGPAGDPVRITAAGPLPDAARLRVSLLPPAPANENARLPASSIPATIRRS